MIVLAGFSWLAAGRTDPTGATAVDPTENFTDQLLDPEVYTGELRDITGDGVPDVALFGSPESPTVRALQPESTDRTALWVALVGVGGVLLGAILTPWAQARFQYARQ